MNMSQYQVFLPPVLSSAHPSRHILFHSFALEAVSDKQEGPSGQNSLDRQTAQSNQHDSFGALQIAAKASQSGIPGSPVSLTGALPAAATPGDATFNYTGAIDSELQMQRRASRSSARFSENSESQKQMPPTGTTTVSQEDSYDTTAASTLPPTNTGFASSLAHIPQIRVPLHRLMPLARLLAPSHDGLIGPVSLLVCVVQVDEIKTFRTASDKKGFEEATGKVASWSVVVPPTAESGEVSSTVTFWGRCAEDACGGAVRRGDVVLLEDASYKAGFKPEISLSNHARPQPSFRVLYRTLPRYETTTIEDYQYKGPQPGFQPPNPELLQASRQMMVADRSLRPDMRVGRSDAAVRKVGKMATWFATWVGGEPPMTR